MIFADGGRTQADLIVAADGTNSKLRDSLGLLAKRKPLATISAADLAVSAQVRSTVLDVAQRPLRTAGRKIVDDGNAAAELVDFLAARRLI